MNSSKETDPTVQLDSNSSDVSRRLFFKRATAVGANGALVVAGLGALASAKAKPEIGKNPQDDRDYDSGHLTKQGLNVLVAAQLAEPLAVRMYSNIINIAPFFPGIPDDDQGYRKGALQEEMSDYWLEQSVANQSIPVNFCSFPSTWSPTPVRRSIPWWPWKTHSSRPIGWTSEPSAPLTRGLRLPASWESKATTGPQREY
jgi:hypothetical protein